MVDPEKICGNCGNQYYGFTGNREDCDRCGGELVKTEMYDQYKRQTEALDFLNGLQKQVQDAVEQLSVNKKGDGTLN